MKLFVRSRVYRVYGLSEGYPAHDQQKPGFLRSKKAASQAPAEAQDDWPVHVFFGGKPITL